MLPISEKSIDSFFYDDLNKCQKEYDFSGRTRDDIMDMVTKMLTPATDEQKKAIKEVLESFLEKIYANLFDDKSIELIKALLEDPKYIDKAALIDDGSFVNFRIWSFVNVRGRDFGAVSPEVINANIVVGLNHDDTEDPVLYHVYKDMSPKEQLDFLYEAYDVIPFQIRDVPTMIETELEFDAMENLDDYLYGCGNPDY